MRLPLLLSLIVLTSCASNHRGFHLYMTAPAQQAAKGYPIQGIYFLTDLKKSVHYYEPPISLFLYGDGSVLTFNMNGMSRVADTSFWEKPEEYLKNVNYMVAGGAGVFQIDNRKIVIETIGFKGGIPQIGVNRFEGTIGSDSTIQLLTQICEWCPDKFANYPKNGVRSTGTSRYRFYPTDNLPDPNRHWVMKTRWYKKGRKKS